MEADSRDSQILVLLPFAIASPPSLSEVRKARALIEEIRKDGSDANAGEAGPSNEVSRIPWHISNKYYDADVHFKISSLSFSAPKAAAKRPTRVKTAADGTDRLGLSVAGVEEDDEELKRRVRDVFEALNSSTLREYSEAKGTASRVEPDWVVRLLEEKEGVEAVMMIVDSGVPIQDHKALLQKLESTHEGHAVLSGFDLSISLVVALPAALKGSESTASHVVPAFEEVYELYAGKGWEYVDLAEQMTGYDAYLDDEAEPDSGSGESQGIERVREALETHAWPQLTRRRGRRIERDALDIAEKRLDAAAPIPMHSDEQDLEQIMHSLALESAAQERTFDHAEATEQDEKLAREFLKSIFQSQLSSDQVPPQSDTLEEPPAKSLQKMQEELESFLESQDANWPTKATTQSIADDDGDAWQLGRDGSAASLQQPAFDDDFSEFVQPTNKSFQQYGLGNAETETSRPSGEEADLDLDDIAFLRALEDDSVKESMLEGDMKNAERIGMQLETSLSAILAQAERVRSIQDPEKRRDEAARVALAMVREQH